MYLIGQQKNKQLVDNGHLDDVSFIIIVGPKHLGKTYLTKYYAEHCGMQYMELDYKVATVRDLVKSSNFDNNCVYHFKDFENSSASAKAALLKVAEETPKGVKIVVTTSKSNILQTLTSRAYVIQMDNYTPSEINEYVDVLNFEQHTYSRLKQLNATITPSLLIKYKECENLVELIERVEYTFEQIDKGLTLPVISELSNKFWKEDKERVIIYLDLLSRKCLQIKKDNTRVNYQIQLARWSVDNYSLNNYRLLINNMLMEVL